MLVALTCVLTFDTDGLSLCTSLSVYSFPRQATPPTLPLPLSLVINQSTARAYFSTVQILTKEKPHAGGSLKLTRSLWPEDNEPAAASFFITGCTSAACWEMGHRRSCQLRWAGRGCERLQAGMAGGRALFVPGGFSLFVDHGITGRGGKRKGTILLCGR